MNKSIQKVNILNGAHKTTKAPISNNTKHNGTFVAVKQQTNGTPNSGVQWTVKSLMDPNNSKGFSNFNAWLSPPKKHVDGKSSFPNSPSNGAHPTHHSGYDLTKLYPELSSKLGLTKISNNETTSYTVNQKAKVQLSALHNSSHNLCNDSLIKLPVRKAVPKNSNIVVKNSNKHSNIKLQNAAPTVLSVNGRNKVNGTKVCQPKLKKVCLTQSVKPPPSVTVLKSVKQEKYNISNEEFISSEKHPSAGTTYSPAYGSAQRQTIVDIYPQKIPALPKDEKLSASVIRVQSLYKDYYAYCSDLFPLGFENSDHDSITENNLVASSLPNDTFFDKEDYFSGPSNFPNCEEVLSDSRRQVSSARERLKYQKENHSNISHLTKALIEAARDNPRLAAATVSHFTNKSSGRPSKKRNTSFQTSLLKRRICAYELKDGAECGQDALPGTRHCIKHITYNIDQQLFSQCSAKLEDNCFCRIPTFDVLHDPPLCDRHLDFVQDIPTLQPAPEVRKARKKNKMPILSRYGKRSKKRRRSSVGSTTIIPSTSVRPSINSPGVCLGSPQAASPLTPRTSPTFPNTCSVKAEENESANELEVMDSSISLDDATSRLLDSRDLQEVFNGFPASEFSQIFSGPETKGESSGEEFDTNKIDTPHPVVDKEFTSSSDSGLGNGDPSLEPHPPTHLPLPLETNVLSELANNGSIDSIISSSFNQQELNTISQVLSNMVHDDTLNLATFQLNNTQGFVDSDILKNEMAVLEATDTNMCFDSENQPVLSETLKNQNDSAIDPLNSGADCKISLVRQANKLQIDTPTLPPLQ